MSKLLQLMLVTSLVFSATSLQAREESDIIVVNNEVFEKGISAEQIQTRNKELGAQISEDYKNVADPIVFVGVLTGAVYFAVDLTREVTHASEIRFLKADSYGNEKESCGTVTISHDLTKSLEGRHVIIVEDIIDTGRTMKAVYEHIRAKNPASIKIASLIYKKDRLEVELNFPLDYIGFEIEPRFVIGCGLDFGWDKENWQTERNLPSIYALKSN